MNNSNFTNNNLLDSSSGFSGSSGSPISSSFSQSLQSSDSGTSMFSNIGWTTWVIIILVLAFLGFNIFVYLAKGTQVFANIAAFFAGLFGQTAAETTKQIVSVSATGTKAGVDVAAGTVTSAVDVTQQIASQNVIQSNTNQSNELNTILNSSKPEEEGTYQADESSSTIQSSKSSGKSGWCFIGEDRGFRSCIEVGQNDSCMSGNIFPSQEICMNPSLRA